MLSGADPHCICKVQTLICCTHFQWELHMSPATSERPARPTHLRPARELSVGEKRRRQAQIASGLKWKQIVEEIERVTGKPTTRQMLEHVVKDTNRSRRVAEAFASIMREAEAVFNGPRPVVDPTAVFQFLFPHDEYPMDEGSGDAAPSLHGDGAGPPKEVDPTSPDSPLSSGAPVNEAAAKPEGPAAASP